MDSLRRDLFTALLSVWFTVGLFLDAWAHNNVPRLETFFTPWHAVFYSGFSATATWLIWTVRHELTRGGRLNLRTLPAGYPAAMIAIAVFAVAGFGDYLWHTAFGIERDIAILFSPTHLALIGAMIVIVTTPLRAAWADERLPEETGLQALLPAVIGTALAAAMVLLFAQYANALSYDADSIAFGLSNRDEEFTARLMAAMAVTTLVLLLPLLHLTRRWRLPVGAATLLYATAGALSAAITAFANLPIVLTLLAAGVGTDLLALRLRPGPDRPAATRAFATLAPLLTWALVIAVARLVSPAGIAAGPSTLELTAGAPLVQALLGLLTAQLFLAGRRHPAPAALQPTAR